MVALVDIRTRPPRARLDSGPTPSWKPPRVEVALIAGYHPPGYKAHWLLLGRDGEPTRSLPSTRLFAFNMAGYRAALVAARNLRLIHAPRAIDFTARVVVYGDWAAPQEVVEAWRVEGRPEPQHVGSYPFEWTATQ